MEVGTCLLHRLLPCPLAVLLLPLGCLLPAYLLIQSEPYFGQDVRQPILKPPALPVGEVPASPRELPVVVELHAQPTGRHLLAHGPDTLPGVTPAIGFIGDDVAHVEFLVEPEPDALVFELEHDGLSLAAGSGQTVLLRCRDQGMQHAAGPRLLVV